MSLQFPLIIEFEYWEITNLINRQTLAEQVFNGFWTELILTRSQSLVNSSGWLTGRGRELTDPIGRLVMWSRTVPKKLTIAPERSRAEKIWTLAYSLS